MTIKARDKIEKRLEAGYYAQPEVIKQIASLICDEWATGLNLPTDSVMGLLHQLSSLVFLVIQKANYTVEGVEATVETLDGNRFKIKVEKNGKGQ